MTTLILTSRDIRALLSMKDVIDEVEQAFRDWEGGAAEMPPKVYLSLDKGDFRAMPVCIPGAAGIKWVNVHPENPRQNLPTVMATIIYNAPETGYPLAIMDGTDITAYRTGAASAIASKYMAKKGAETLGLVGAGRQAETQLLAHAELFKLKQINVYDIRPAATLRFVEKFAAFPVRAATLEETAAADIICTATTSRQPVVMKGMVRPGTHINAVGADAAGKQELDPAILKKAVVVVDDLRQASHGGEINAAIAKGLLTPLDVYANLSEVVTGKKPGRRDDKDITVFDSTGVAIEDIAAAKVIYERAAAEREKYLSLDFI